MSPDDPRHVTVVGYDPELVLAGGQWVPVRGVLRWVPGQPNPTPQTVVIEPDPPIQYGPHEAPRTVTAEPGCGTEAGYQWHRHQGRKYGAPWPLPLDDPCACRAAHRVAERLRAATLRIERERLTADNHHERSA